MLQRLPITLAQYNTSENFIKEFQQIIYSLYRVEEITKKALEISETSDPHRLFLNSSDEINLKRKDKYVALSNFSIYFTWRKKKKWYKNNEFRISAPTRNEEFEFSDGSYSVWDIEDYFEYILIKHGTVNNNASIMIYVNKIENRITFKIKAGYYLEVLTPETMTLL